MDKILITGGTRGIGKAIALRFAKAGASISFLAKTEVPHPKLAGTLQSVAEEITVAGGKAFPQKVDIRDETALEAAVHKAAQEMGGIDLLINNASAITLLGTEMLPAKQLDLMLDVNIRGTFLTVKFALPYLKQSANAGVITLSPPLNLEARWFENHGLYTLSKYGMSMLSLGWSAEFQADNIWVHCVWPATLIDTAAIRNMPGGEYMCKQARKPEIMADAVYYLTCHAASFSDIFLTDEFILKQSGVPDLESYSVQPGTELLPDLFL